MPQTKKGAKVMAALKKEYGPKAENVYYGLIVKGKLKGAEGKGGTGKLAKARRTYARKHKKNIRLDKDELIREHSHLVKVLKSGKGLKKEAQKQVKELKEYKHRKVRVRIDNKIKDYGQEIDHPNGKHTIIINRKKNRGKNLLDTLYHERYHAKHPKASEKTTYAKTNRAMRRMTPAMRKRLLEMLPSSYRK